METSVVDELYGDLDQGHHGEEKNPPVSAIISLDSVLNYDEDSVDIYSGLEDSPRKKKEHGKKDGTFLSPNRVKESLDLYEELVTQEREEKDATYNELKSKFAAAQKQVQDLLAQLQQMQTKNSSLHHENALLKKNMCGLIKTAKMEIIRKDEEINKLYKRSSWGHFRSSAKERHEAYNRSSASLNHLAGPVKESQDLKRDKLLAEVSRGKALFNQPSDSFSVDSTPSPSVVLRSCARSDIEDPLKPPSKDSHSLDLLPDATTRDRRHAQGSRPSCSREKESTSTDSKTIAKQKVCDETDRRKGKESTSREKDVSEKSQYKMDKNRSEREQRESSKSSYQATVNGKRLSSNGQRQQQDEPVTLRRAGRSRSPSENADVLSGKEESRHEQSQCRHAKGSGTRSKKSSLDKSYRSSEKRGTRDHHRKKERRQDSERRRTRCDGIEEYRHKKTLSEERNRQDEKTSSEGDRRSTRSETSKEHERQDAKDSGTTKGVRNNADKTRVIDGKDRSRTDVRENGRHAALVKPQQSSQNRKTDEDDRRRTSGRTVESSRSKASSGHDDSKGYAYMSSDRHGVSKERRDKVKPSDTPDQGPTIAPEGACVRIPKASEDGNVQEDSLVGAIRKSPTELNPSCDRSGIQEESSPKRKLNFMETLNLTVSPIKKQSSSQPQPPSEDTLANISSKNSHLFEVGVEFFDIDEVKGDSVDDSLTLPTNSSTQPNDANPLTSLEFKEKELAIPKWFDGNLNEPQSGKVDGKVFEVQEEESIVRPLVLLTDLGCKDQDSQASVRKDKERKIIGAKNSGEGEQVVDLPDNPIVQNDTSQPEVAIFIMPPSSTTAKTCSNMENSVSLEVVSSTISVKNNHQSKETIMDSDMQITHSLENSGPGPLMGPSAEVVNINTTAQEKEIPEQASSFKPDSTENEMEISWSSQPVVVPHDEDSMLLTLSNITIIPEAISPLTSPVRQIKSQQQRMGKETHVKSLDKDFSTSAAEADKDALKMDMNKENKRPDSLETPSLQKDQQEALSSTATEEDLEEGELISESDGEGALVIQSPPVEKRSGLRNQTSPKSPRLQKKSRMRPVTPSHKEQEKKTTCNDSPSSNKRRFKTVTVPPKAKISTCAEFMNMLLFIRSELRRKYMKLHKNVTKPAFFCIIEMSQASFAEYVDSVNFDKFCSQGNYIKARLNKIIQSVMGKVSNNGIVNRIFEQQAEDLKQKLWNFVDSQFDFLFKELKAALKSAPDSSKHKSCLESKQPNPGAKQDLDVDVCKIQTKEPLSTTENRPQKKTKGEMESEGQKVQVKIVPFHSMHCRGLGSSGKNIKATMEEGAKVPTPNPSSEQSLQEIVPAHENKTPNYTRRLSHSGSIQDRADFEILTEQQTSSLTFNLVTDSQMGDIFRCLLQGSDLLETGDNQNWPLNTPRKEGQAGENLLGLMTPSKMFTPSKLITTWTPVSPYKFQMPLNPAVLDENCMLEIPSNAVTNQSTPVATASSQQSYSVLAEDLAVSLTIPSPLKSDGHLSFLHPSSRQPLTTPSNVISAHFSEDALLDGEDATEQDIHLSLETDNSSSPSSTSGNWDAFQFKPNLPMQAEVMERSNDHFIVRIRQTCPGPQVEPVEENQGTLPDAEVLSSQTWDLSLHSADGSQVTLKENGEEMATKNTSDGVLAEGSTVTSPKTATDQIEEAAASTDLPEVTAATESEHVEKKACESVAKKRKKHHSGPKAKRSRREKSQDNQEKRRQKKSSKSSKEINEKTPLKKIKTPSPQLSPNSLSAKNVIRKKGEVVVTWTREEDRDILVTLKKKGASSKTFDALATQLSKSQAQIVERFSQLMKLFKKKEKLES